RDLAIDDIEIVEVHDLKEITKYGLTATPAPQPLDPALFAAPAPVPAATAAENGLCLVLPVHDAFDLLPAMLDRLVRHTDLPWQIVVIEDASTDPQVRPWLRDWAAARNRAAPATVDLIENDANLGFVGSANLGLARAARAGRPVVLINSDALVPPGWASRLIAPFADPRVASVTPMSNDAEILSVPAICAARPLGPGQAEAIDRVAAGLAAAAAQVALPTGVGFCMAIAAPWLARVPGFDAAFGRGYGEEVDWCQRVRALGGRHLAQARLFVEHRGGASFGALEKQRRIAQAGRIIDRRYPRYGAEVQAFIADDPLSGPRLALAIAWLASGGDGRGADAGGRAIPIHVAHSLGGGAEIHLAGRLDEDRAAGGAAVLRLGGAQRWQVELHLPGAPPLIGTTNDFALVRRLLAPIARRRLIYSCAVGDSDPAALPDLLCTLAPGSEDRIEMLFHDFFPLSPSYTLLDAAGRFRGVPAVDDPDPAHQGRRPDGRPVGLSDWRAAWHRLAARADLVVFSQDSRDHVAAAWPDLARRITIRPHRPHQAVPRIAPPPAGRPPAIGILGNIVRHKGLAPIVELARLAEVDGAGPRFVVIGNTDPAVSLPRSLAVHGDYRLAELPALVARYGIRAWLIPSICPETFSYTTHEALSTGLPVFCLDLGAQAEAVRGAANGIVLPLAPAGDLAAAVLDGLRAHLDCRKV
ncbi:MAG: glycosyl transferase, partial [Alphaproteobacteria bacterium HGW-Alphaproteobacteria-5]